ncbi:MAG: hypothetical protein GQ559_00570 [Desulfobulbaceae bacterium]|nr:hypothetical protein [Desulfobulbaceae bacterium]
MKRITASISFRAAIPVLSSLTMLVLFSTTSHASEECTQLVKKKCIRCHFETRICQKIEKRKGKGSWKRTIKTMVKNGATLSKSERKQLADCLSKPGPEILKFCGLDK